MTEYPDYLQKADILLISNSICDRKDWYNNRITDRMVCAGLPFGGKDACAVSHTNSTLHIYKMFFFYLDPT